MIGEGPPPSKDGDSLGLSLPLASLNKSADASFDGQLETTRYRRTESQLKSQKLDAHKGVCSEITPYLYVSGNEVVSNKDLLDRHGITQIINCAALHVKNEFEGELKYMSINMYDTKEGEEVGWFMYEVIEAIVKERELGGKTLIHCIQGVSRSCTFCMGYLMFRDGLTYDEAFKQVKALRPIASPNIAFICNMLEWHKVRTQFPFPENHQDDTQASEVTSEVTSDIGSSLVLRIAAHGSHDPTRLVAKLCRSELSEGLSKISEARDCPLFDSRGCFIVVVRKSDSVAKLVCYVWKGSEASDASLKCASDYCLKMAQYEGLNFSFMKDFTVVLEGEESLEYSNDSGRRDTSKTTSETNIDLLLSLPVDKLSPEEVGLVEKALTANQERFNLSLSRFKTMGGKCVDQSSTESGKIEEGDEEEEEEEEDEEGGASGGDKPAISLKLPLPPPSSHIPPPPPVQPLNAPREQGEEEPITKSENTEEEGSMDWTGTRLFVVCSDSDEGWEELLEFEEYDLTPTALCLLLDREIPAKLKVYAWLGKECTLIKSSPDITQVDSLRSYVISSMSPSKQRVLGLEKESKDAEWQIEKDGDESDEFWRVFNTAMDSLDSDED